MTDVVTYSSDMSGPYSYFFSSLLNAQLLQGCRDDEARRMVSWRSVLGGRFELGRKWAVEVLRTSIIFRGIQVAEAE